MEIIPAIYILDGMCVALYKADFKQKQTYFQNPVHQANTFEKEGAKKIHVVDLNGKMKKTFEQQEIIKKLIQTVSIPVQVEAGFNTIAEIQTAFDLGAAVVVLRSPGKNLTQEAITKFGPEKIIIQIQSKGSELVDGDRIRPDQEIDVVDYAETLVPLGVKSIIYKDERSEGTMIHPNYDEVDRLFLTVGQDLKIYVSGGISDEKHLKLLKKIGASGAIIGKAFYEKLLSIRQAQSAIAN